MLIGSRNNLNVTGGVFEEPLFVQYRSIAHVEGGVFEKGVMVRNRGEVHLRGYAFTQDGEAIASLTPGMPTLIETRDFDLGGVLLDGNEFLWTLNSEFAPNQMQFSPDSILTLTLVEFPGDFNHDGYVDAADYTVWRDGLGDAYAQYDFLVWKENFGASIYDGPALTAESSPAPAPVPEPASIALGLLGVLAASIIKRSPLAMTQRHG